MFNDAVSQDFQASRFRFLPVKPPYSQSKSNLLFFHIRHFKEKIYFLEKNPFTGSEYDNYPGPIFQLPLMEGKI